MISAWELADVIFGVNFLEMVEHVAGACARVKCYNFILKEGGFVLESAVFPPATASAASSFTGTIWGGVRGD